jgi:hypothetical protein
VRERSRKSRGWGDDTKHTILAAPLGAIVHGGAVPILWVIGIILIVVGVVAVLRRSLVMGVVLIVIGILLGGLNVVWRRPHGVCRAATVEGPRPEGNLKVAQVSDPTGNVIGLWQAPVRLSRRTRKE